MEGNAWCTMAQPERCAQPRLCTGCTQGPGSGAGYRCDLPLGRRLVANPMDRSNARPRGWPLCMPMPMPVVSLPPCTIAEPAWGEARGVRQVSGTKSPSVAMGTAAAFQQPRGSAAARQPRRPQPAAWRAIRRQTMGCCCTRRQKGSRPRVPAFMPPG